MVNVRRISMAYNNVYALEQDGDLLLVDTGPDYAGAKDVLTDALRKLPSLVAATHGHNDHAGLGRWWQEKGVPVGLGERDSQTPHLRRLGTAEERAGLEAFVESCGAPEDVKREALAAMQRSRERARVQADSPGYAPAGEGQWPTALRYEPFEPLRILRDGDELLGKAATVLLCPGHTPGNLVLFAPAEGWLFSGDQLLPDITPTPGLQWEARRPERFRSLPEFRASLLRLAGLQISRCFPGHGEPFDQVQAVITTNLEQIEQRTEKVYDVLREGPAHVYGLSERMYPRVLKRRFWQIVATVQGHVDVLEADGHCLRLDDGTYAAVD